MFNLIVMDVKKETDGVEIYDFQSFNDLKEVMGAFDKAWINCNSEYPNKNANRLDVWNILPHDDKKVFVNYILYYENFYCQFMVIKVNS